MDRTIEVLDPTAEAVIHDAAMAPRLTELEGTVIAFLDNSKPNADILLGRVEELLKARFCFSDVLHARKRVAAPASDQLYEDLASRAQVVVNAIGD